MYKLQYYIDLQQKLNFHNKWLKYFLVIRASHKYNYVFEDIVYFDSEEVGIQCGRGMSVFTFCVECGINYTLLNQALRYYEDHRKSMFRPKTYNTGRSDKGRFLDLGR